MHPRFSLVEVIFFLSFFFGGVGFLLNDAQEDKDSIDSSGGPMQVPKDAILLGPCLVGNAGTFRAALSDAQGPM